MKLAYGGQEIGNLKQLEAGTGTTIEAGKINVALPVRSVTAAEYAALPEAEKQAEEDARQVAVVKTAISQYNAERKVQPNRI